MKRKQLLWILLPLLVACNGQRQQQGKASESFWLTCFSERNNQLEYALDFAGKNRGELEKVLEHYIDSGLKYKAACFLIENMPHCYSYVGDELDSLKEVQVALYCRKDLSPDSYRKWKQFSYRHLPKIYDAHVITANYLIENIDLAFNAWQCRPWRDTLTFDEFCEWILPYRIGNEPLENWRKVFYDKYSGMIDSLSCKADMVMTADSLMKVMKKASGEVYAVDFDLPHLGAFFLMEHCIGYCRESCDLAVYGLRSLGIPVAIDCFLNAPDAQGGHTWCALKDGTGIIPFDYGQVVRGNDDYRKKGKVYRLCFSRQKEKMSGMMNDIEVPLVLKNPYRKDVTSEYFGENRLKVEVDMANCSQRYVYLGTFSFSGWKPIDIAVYNADKAEFKNVEPGVIYVPLTLNNGILQAVGYPFWLVEGKIEYFHPSHSTERVKLLRKYPLRKWTRIHLEEIVGGCFEASETPDFKQMELLYQITDTPQVNYNAVECQPKKKYRYVRYSAAENKQAHIAELILFNSENSVREIPVTIIAGSESYMGNEEVTKEKLCDGNYLTYFLSDKKGGYAVLDLGQPEWIRKLVYVPRNDENFISIGDIYELFYQDGASGWKSLGRKIADKFELVYDRVPKYTLLWLHDLSGGHEEQVFYIKDGKQVFLNKW